MSYVMEGFQEGGLWIIFENCESICVPENNIGSFSLQGIKSNKDWIGGEDFQETTTVEGFGLSLTQLADEHEKRLLKHQDITHLHFKGVDYIIEWKGEYDNLYQNTYKAHDTLHINVDKSNYTPWED